MAEKLTQPRHSRHRCFWHNSAVDSRSLSAGSGRNADAALRRRQRVEVGVGTISAFSRTARHGTQAAVAKNGPAPRGQCGAILISAIAASEVRGLELARDGLFCCDSVTSVCPRRRRIVAA
jgi:hypothetical protein